MSDEYLWDRSGPPDPEIERLEQTLARLRYRHRPELVQAARGHSWRQWAAVAAAVVVLAGAATWQFTVAPRPMTAWQVAGIQGRTRMGSHEAAMSAKVRAGQWLRTGAASRLTLVADEVGKVDIGPGSAVHADTDHKIVLKYGVLHAFIWAQPRKFVVDTPSSRAVDLGCEYTLSVDSAGDGQLRVTLGWVAFQAGDQEAFIPEGARCVTRKRSGPGIPYFEDASEEFKQSVEQFEAGDPGALDRILANARQKDGLTLWHLMTRVPEGDRGRVFDRFVDLEPVPKDVTRENVIRKDPHAIDECWDALSLENTAWWRGWERRWQ